KLGGAGKGRNVQGRLLGSARCHHCPRLSRRSDSSVRYVPGMACEKERHVRMDARSSSSERQGRDGEIGWKVPAISPPPCPLVADCQKGEQTFLQRRHYVISPQERAIERRGAVFRRAGRDPGRDHQVGRSPLPGEVECHLSGWV